MKSKRGPKYKMFNGKRYERVGTKSTPNPRVRQRGDTMSLNAWAKFQRDVNGSLCRVVKIAPGVYEAYIRYRR
jgi:hypothetical protein